MQSGEEEKAIAQPVKLMRHTKSASIILHTSLSPLVLCWRELCAWSGTLRQAATRLRLKKGVVNPNSVSVLKVILQARKMPSCIHSREHSVLLVI
jgi:hypothetical protein